MTNAWCSHQRLARKLVARGGSATQRRYFARIRRCLEQAGHEAELATSIRELYSTSAVGFCFSSDATPLIDRILEKAERLARDLEGEYQPRH